MNGRIFDLTEFALHDGHGIRSTVFLKGCPLRCKWCHNPESQSYDKELMVSYEGCSHCGKCSLTCSFPQGCVACGACVPNCPKRLRKIVGEDVEVSRLAETLKKNLMVFEKSGGGVTISGGEPLFQHAFCFELMSEFDPKYITLDTSGHASKEIFKEAMSRASHILFDVKLLDATSHLYYTGVDNELILENLEQLCRGETPFTIRVPLISGVNDDEVFASDLCRLIRGAPCLLNVDLLPYNKGAGMKYKMLGRSYEPEFDQHTAQMLQMDVYKRYGVNCVNRGG